MTIGQRRLAVTFAVALAGIVLLGSSCKLANKAPSVPTISGPTTGVAGVALTFTATATDPESDSIAFQFDWGDGATPAWTSFVASGDTITATNTYADSGTVTIRAKAKDKSGKESDWSAGQTLSLLAAAPVYPDTIVAEVWVPWHVHGVCMSPDGSLVCMGPSEEQDSLLVYRTSDRSVLPRIQMGSDIDDVAISSDNRYVYGISYDSGLLVRVDLTLGTMTSSSRPYGHRLRLVSPGDSLLFASNGDKLLKVSASDLTLLDSALLPSTPAGMTLTKDGSTIYVSTYGGIGVVDVARCSLETFSDSTGSSVCAVLSPDEQLLYASSQADSGLVVLRTSDLSIVSHVKLHAPNNSIFALSPDGVHLYVDRPYSIHVFDTRTMALVDSVGVSTDGWGDILVHPGGDSVYYVGYRRVYVIGKTQ